MDTEYEKWQEQQKKEGKPWSKITKNLNLFHILIFIGIIILALWAVSSGKIDGTLMAGAIVFITLGVLFFLYKKPEDRKEIPEEIIKGIVQKKLEAKKGKEGIPFDCTIKVLIQNNSIYKDNWITGESGAIRDVGFQVIRKGYKRTGVVGVNSFTGNINGIRDEPLGYSGKGEQAYRTVVVPFNTVEVPDKPK